MTDKYFYFNDITRTYVEVEFEQASKWTTETYLHVKDLEIIIREVICGVRKPIQIRYLDDKILEILNVGNERAKLSRLKDGYFSVSFPGSESYCFRYVEAARECFNMDKGIEGEF